MSRKFVKHHEFIKRILKKRMKKKKIVHLKNLAIEKMKENHDKKRKRYSKSRHDQNFAKKRLKSK
jgi:hypothetical protein